MRLTPRTRRRPLGQCAAIVALLIASGASAFAQELAAEKPVPPDIYALMTMRGIDPGAPIYIRLFKEESELEVWKALPDGRYVALKTYPVCTWSGSLGPKVAQGDQMAPEGFYGFGPGGLNPASKYHLALNVGYPNALDRALGRTGNFIMVHGRCVSVGCFAMTDDLIEEIYALARDAVMAGEAYVPVHIFPFRMTGANMARHAGHPAFATWRPLKQAYDDFAKTYVPPRVGMCGGRYVVNPLVALDGGPSEACPSRIGRRLAPMSPKLKRLMASLNTPLVAEGPKTKTAGDSAFAVSERLAASPAGAGKPGTARSDRGRIGAANTYDSGALTPLLDRR